MLGFGKKWCLVAVVCLVGCAYPHERYYEIDDFDEVPLVYDDEVSDPAYSTIPCQEGDGGFLKSRLWSDKKVYEICSLKSDSKVNSAGRPVCSGKKRCSDEAMLPPQPCTQPMPLYYGDISATETAEGIVLVHPYTRVEVVCFDMPGASAVDCANNFRQSGYVLVTDIPQFSAEYDYLKDGMYPGRKWRGGGEQIPRW